MRYVNSESAKRFGQYTFFWNKLSLFEEVAFFSIISFKIAINGFEKYCYFPLNLVRTSFMGYVNCESAKNIGQNTFILK